MSISSEITRISGNISDSFTAVAEKGVTVPSGSTSDDLPGLIRAIQQSGGNGIVVTEEPDTNGGTVKVITAVDLSSDTVDAEHLLTGYTAHDRFGNAVSGSYVPSGSTPTQTKTATPTESQQTITPDTGYLLSSVTVEAISSSYVGSGVTKKAAATITPTKNTQTIASGTYLTGTQTIAAIPAAYQDVTGVTAAAGDVVSGKSIVSSTGATVNGTLVIQHYYTGSGTPSSSQGENGDIYLQVVS